MVVWVQVSEASGMKSTVTTIRAGCCAWILHSPASLPAPRFINGVQPTNPMGRDTNYTFFFVFYSVRHKVEIQASCLSYPTIRLKSDYRKTFQKNSSLRGGWFQLRPARVSTVLWFVFTFASFCRVVWVGSPQGLLGGGLLTRASSLLHNIAASGAEEEQLLTGNLPVAHWRSCVTAIINVGGPCKQKGDEIGNRNGNLKKKKKRP